MKILTEIALGVGTMSVEDLGNITDEELVKIYTPIRKALNSRYHASPTIIPGAGENGATKTITFLGGASMRKELIAFAMNDFERYLRRYASSSKNLEMFVEIMKTELNVKGDIITIIPTQAWLESQAARA